MKILVVEDEPSLNQIIAKRLKIEGYSVDQAENGRDALEFVALAEYDLLIVDILMPEMDGLTLVHTLREKNVTVPVLFLTALDGTEDKVKGLDAGGDDYLVKPFFQSSLPGFGPSCAALGGRRCPRMNCSCPILSCRRVPIRLPAAGSQSR